MMWKTLIFLALASVVLAGKLSNKRHANYAFQIKHDYDYQKHHEKLEHHEEEKEETPVEDKKEEELVEEVQNEPEQLEQLEQLEQSEENNDSNAEPEEAENDDENEFPGYEFSYKVIDPHTHDKKGQHEKKIGGVIKGVYWLLQPDGYKRTVDYQADKHHGFQAKVDYSKPEEHNEDEGHSKAKSEIYVKTYRGAKKYIPVIEEQEDETEQDKQEESAQHIPIYVI